MNDYDVLDTVKDGLSGVHMHTPVEAIVSGGRSRRRRRRSGLAVAGVAVVGLAVGTALNVSATAPPGSASSAVDQNHPRLAAFTVVSSPDGTATVTLAKGPSLDPEALRTALADAGVPALIKVGSFCQPNGRVVGSEGKVVGPDGKVAGLDQVLRSERRPDGTVVLVITPSAMPAGAQLSIGFKPESAPGTKDRIRFTLVAAGAPVTCSNYG